MSVRAGEDVYACVPAESPSEYVRWIANFATADPAQLHRSISPLDRLQGESGTTRPMLQLPGKRLK